MACVTIWKKLVLICPKKYIKCQTSISEIAGEWNRYLSVTIAGSIIPTNSPRAGSQDHSWHNNAKSRFVELLNLFEARAMLNSHFVHFHKSRTKSSPLNAQRKQEIVTHSSIHFTTWWRSENTFWILNLDTVYNSHATPIHRTDSKICKANEVRKTGMWESNRDNEWGLDDMTRQEAVRVLFILVQQGREQIIPELLLK